MTSIGALLIWGNPSLTDLSGLSRVHQVEQLDVGGNALRTLSGLENAEVLGALHIGESELETLESLTSVRSPAGITINGSPRLKDLEGFTKSRARRGTAVARRQTLPFTTLRGLRNLTSAGAVQIVRMNVPDLSGLEQLMISDGGELRVEECAALSSLKGLPSSPTSLRTLSVHACPKLTDLSGLEAIQEVSLVFEIDGNARLANLAGLGHLQGVGNFSIANNPVLTSLSALASLSEIRDVFTVTGNPRLPKCQAAALRATAAANLDDGNVNLTGNDNAASCP